MSKAEWTKELVETLIKEALKPSFIYDQTRISKLVNTYARKVSELCHNGKTVGSDECVVCRAFHTNQLRPQIAILERKVQGGLQEVLKLQQTHKEVRDQLAASREAFKRLEAQQDTEKKAALRKAADLERQLKHLKSVTTETHNHTVCELGQLRVERDQARRKLEEVGKFVKNWRGSD